MTIKVFIDFFVLFSITGLRIFLMFRMSVEDNRAHSLILIVSLKKFLISDDRGLGIKEWCFGALFFKMVLC